MKKINAGFAIAIFLSSVAATGCSKAADTSTATNLTTTTTSAGDNSKKSDASTTTAKTDSEPVSILALDACATIAVVNYDLSAPGVDTAKRMTAKNKMIAAGKPPADVVAAMQTMVDLGGITSDPKSLAASDTIAAWIDKVCPKRD